MIQTKICAGTAPKDDESPQGCSKARTGQNPPTPI
jgi:hypothetical protein